MVCGVGWGRGRGGAQKEKDAPGCVYVRGFKESFSLGYGVGYAGLKSRNKKMHLEV